MPEETTPKPKKSRKNIRDFSIALLFVVPAFLFWATVATVLIVILAFAGADDEGCNIARVPVQGVIMTTDNGLGMLLGFGAITSADSIVEEIMEADKNENVHAIVLDVDSPGGTPVAGDEIMRAIQAAKKPTVAVVRDRGTSAAYWAAVGADHIIASAVSDVGSIGVTMSYLELASSTDFEGSRWIDISSGEYKDAGHPERALSDKEREHFQGQVDNVHEYMVDQIASAREDLSRDEIAELSDGRAYLGNEALDLKLIDEIGGFDEAIYYLEKELFIDEEVIICPAKGGGLEDLIY